MSNDINHIEEEQIEEKNGIIKPNDLPSTTHLDNSVVDDESNQTIVGQTNKWRDRCNRLENALSKQRERVAELEETESKLKRFLLMTKRSIENSKQDIEKKDKDIEKKDKDIEGLKHEKDECLAEIEKIKEEFRRYRVRSEIARKQKDTEIEKAQANSAVHQQQLISGSDLSAELNSAREQIRRLSKLQSEIDEHEIQWRQKYEKLARENERLKGAAGETAMAAEWRERYDNVVREKEELLGRLDGGVVAGNASTLRNMNSGALEDNYLKLKKEYAMYRKRALQVVEEKEQALLAAQNQLTAAGLCVDATVAAATSSTSVSADQKTDEYLKNIVFKYMSTEQAEVKEHMETAIATLLKFTPNEFKHVQDKRKNAIGWTLW